MALWRKSPAPPTRTVRIHRGERMLTQSIASVQASALVKQPADKPSPSGTGGQTRSWQKESWDYYDTVGELHYAATFVGNCLSRVRLTVALPDEDGVPGPAFDENGKSLHPDADLALAYLRELRSDVAGESQIMRALGLNIFVAGECFLVGTEEPIVGRSWEVLSVDELREKREKRANGTTRYERVESPGAKAVDLPEECLVLRIWQSHPRWSYLADSAVRAVRDILEEIVLLTREVRGQAMSRLAAAGLLLVPSEIVYEDDEAASDESDEGDPFTRDLIRTLATAVTDLASAASVVPFVLRGPSDFLDKVRHIGFERPRDMVSLDKRKESIQRFAQGVDLPVEIVTGHAQTTFSNAWQIDESTYKAHLEPKLATLLDALTVSYLRPLLPGTPLIVSGDVSELVSHPDRSMAAVQSFDRFELSGASLRNELGFSDGDAPDDAEVAARVDRLVKIKAGSRGEPGIAALTPPPTTGNPAAVKAAAEVAVLRAVERAGARLRSKSNGTPWRTMLAGIPDIEVAATLGPDRVRSLAGEDELFRGEFRMLRSWACAQMGERNADLLLSAVEREARSRLYSPRIGASIEP